MICGRNEYTMTPKNKGKGLIKGIGIYAIGTFGTKILSFLIVPLYTYYIATSDMGVYDIIMSTVQLLAPIMTMQISDAAYRWIIRDDIEDKSPYIRATVHVLLINCTITILLIAAVNCIHSIPYCMYFCIVLVLNRTFQTIQKILRGLKNQLLFALSGIVYTLVFLILNVIQLCVLKQGVDALFQSTAIACIAAIIVIYVFEPRFRINYLERIQVKLILEMYRYSIPLVPNYLNWWVINSSDRYIVLWALGSSANGILAIAHKFPSMLQSILNLFNNSWQDLSVADSEKQADKFYTNVFNIYSSLVLTGMLCLVPITKIIVYLVMSQSYKSACDYIAFYYLGTVFQSFASFYGVGYLRNKKTQKAFTTSVFGAIVNAIVNIVFVKIIGLQAAAISTFAGFLIMWLIREKQNREELNIQVNWKAIWVYTILAIFMCVISILTNIYVNILLLLVGVAGFVILNHKYLLTIKSKIKKKVGTKLKK